MLQNVLKKKVQKNGPAGRKRWDRKGSRTRQKNKRGDSKVESNDSPEIPDRGRTSDISGLPSEGNGWVPVSSCLDRTVSVFQGELSMSSVA